MQMILGFFIFSLHTASYDALDHSFGYKWSGHDRLGKRSTHQYLGVDEETITLSGVLFPAFAGDQISLTVIKEMARLGKAYYLITGTGHVMGEFIIEDVQEKRSFFFDNGAAQKIEFTLKLKRDDDDKGVLESITDALSV